MIFLIYSFTKHSKLFGSSDFRSKKALLEADNCFRMACQRFYTGAGASVAKL
jgi:hypothetical protein